MSKNLVYSMFLPLIPPSTVPAAQKESMRSCLAPSDSLVKQEISYIFHPHNVKKSGESGGKEELGQKNRRRKGRRKKKKKKKKKKKMMMKMKKRH